jgi:hypothetical protein
VPSEHFSLDLTAEFLAGKLEEGWRNLDRKGVPRELLASRALLAPSCGLGSLSPELARAAARMVPAVARCLEHQTM